ncbi:hypothetical protein Hanom_Chr06g00534131 [Helianthus anomalus]
MKSVNLLLGRGSSGPGIKLKAAISSSTTWTFLFSIVASLPDKRTGLLLKSEHDAARFGIFLKTVASSLLFDLPRFCLGLVADFVLGSAVAPDASVVGLACFPFFFIAVKKLSL